MTPTLTNHRSITYRLLPGCPGKVPQRAHIAGAGRYVWNRMLDLYNRLHHMQHMHGVSPQPPTFFNLGQSFTRLRRETP